jgi:predicted XRE-type DNA-binding protein
MKKTNRVVTRTARELARALALAPEDAIEIDVRLLLVDKIVSAVAQRDLTHSEAARLVRTSRSRMTAILNRNTQDVSTDLLLRIVGRLGYRARVTFTRTATISPLSQTVSRRQGKTGSFKDHNL